MKKLLIACFLLACTVSLFAAAQSSGGLKELSGWTDARDEVARLEAMIAAAKDAGFPPDPAWTARIRELLPQVKGHPGRTSYPLPEILPQTDFPPGSVVSPEPLTPLEAEIRRLEFELTGGLGAQAPDPLIFADLKEQLNILYAQREQNHARNPLDQGNDACPGTLVSGIPYYDSGTTVGRVNNYNPITSCNYTNAPDVIYEFTPQFTYTYNISLQGSSYDTYLYVNTGGVCPGNTQVGCNDDYGNLQSFLSLVLNAGQTYFIIIDGYSANTGAYVLSITDLCSITCEASDVTECWEPTDSSHAYNDCNGACNNITWGGSALWQEILPYQTMCGRVFTYFGPNGNNFRDTDAYRFTLTEACSLRISVDAEFVSKIFIQSDNCPWQLFFDPPAWQYPCSTAYYYTSCLQPGTYNLWVGPLFYSGINDYRDYRVRMELIPCNGCVVDFGVQAPAGVTGSTCGYANNCGLRPSEDVTMAVVIPWASDWTFSLCGGPDEWDSYMYLTSACCSGEIASNDDGCGGVGFSVMNCLSLDRGLYYLTIEGYSSTYCGPYTLIINECYGSCCYGNPAEPLCEYTTPSSCEDYAGTFTYLEPCSSGACYTRPACDGLTVFSQLPWLPDESGNGYFSHIDHGFIQYDNYSTYSQVGSVRFWGFPITCSSAPETFVVRLTNIIDTCFYTVTTMGMQLPQAYFGQFLLSEYAVNLSPPCPFDTGQISIAKLGDPGCAWYWCTSPFGDGIWPSGTADFAFCLGAPCLPPDSVTIKWQTEDGYMMNWWMPQASYITVYSTTDLNSVFPAGYTVFAAGNLPAGHFTWGPIYLPDQILGFVLVNDCSLPLSSAPTPLTIVPQVK